VIESKGLLPHPEIPYAAEDFAGDPGNIEEA
jgi:hypothetical protein